MALNNLLPHNIYEVIDRAGINTPQQIIILSVWDIKKSTNLCINDILLLKNIVAEHISPVSVTGNNLKKVDDYKLKLSTGCVNIDHLLNGGLRKGTITEIFGESGCGKTQVALQIALNNWLDGCVFICTEDVFPIKRFEEIKRNGPNFDSAVDYGKRVFVEHLTEAKDLLSCIRVSLPKLLAQNCLSLIVIDSIAAPFRCENTNYVKRAEELREIAVLLTRVAQEYNLAIVCINQVTANFQESDDVLPSLGLAWSNMVTTRLMIKKTSKIADDKNFSKTSLQPKYFKHECYIRELHVIFAAHLPNTMIQFLITTSGIQSIPD